MEGATAIALAILVLAGGGATGAALMTDAGDWMGHGMMMGGQHGMMDGDAADCPYHDSSDAPCFRGADQVPAECEEHSLEDCPYHDGSASSGDGCCD